MARRGINKVILQGRLGADPDLRTGATSGSKVVTINIATSESWKDKTSGEPRERTDWNRAKFFGKTAENVAKYFKKGERITVEGSLRTNKYEDAQGETKYETYVHANEFQFVDGRNSNASNDGGGGNQASGTAPDNMGDWPDEDDPF